MYTTKKIHKQQTGQTRFFELTPVGKKSVDLRFTGNDLSSDAGALLLSEVDKQIGLIDKLVGSIHDQRDQRYCQHTLKELLGQRIFQICCGYADANDCNALRGDAILKMCNGRLPYEDADLASQPTMSRLENSVTATDVYRMTQALVDVFLASYAKAPPLIILDADDTDTPTYGNQQLCMFNTHYYTYCYMPLHIYEGRSGRLISTVLRPGRRSKAAEMFALLRRVITRIRQVWPTTRIIVRGDAHFCSPELMDWCHEQAKVNFITGLSGNKRLNKLAANIIEGAQSEFKQTGKPVKRYGELSYQAGSWSRAERVIVKVEVNHLGTNIRYVVTDSQAYRARRIYERGYCSRGKMELYIKDHKCCLRSDLASCTQFRANQFRLLLHSASYVLMHNLRTQVLRGTRLSRATFASIRIKLLKVAGWVRELKTKISIELPHSYPYQYEFGKALHLFGHLRS